MEAAINLMRNFSVHITHKTFEYILRKIIGQVFYDQKKVQLSETEDLPISFVLDLHPEASQAINTVCCLLQDLPSAFQIPVVTTTS